MCPPGLCPGEASAALSCRVCAPSLAVPTWGLSVPELVCPVLLQHLLSQARRQAGCCWEGGCGL